MIAPMSTVRRPISLRPDPLAQQREGITTLMRAATAHVLGCERRDKPHEDPAKVAARMWKGDNDVALLTKGAVSPTSTASAAALLTTLTEYFIQSLASVAAGAILIQHSLQLSFDGAAAISVPGFVADASGGSFVGESQPIPSRSLVAQPVLLDPSKLATISGFTEEMIAASGDNAEKMIEDVLTRSVGLALDAALFDANPAIAEVRPAGLRNGVAACTATAGTGTDPTEAMIADVSTLTAVVATVSGTEPIILIAAPARARTMPLRSVALSAAASSYIILPSAALAPGDLIAVAPKAIVSAMDSVPEISARRETVLHFDDTPANIGSAGTPPVVAAPVQSMWQTDCVALRCRLPAAWARRHPNSVAWLTATAW
jgi:hypothetical protein